MDRAFAEADRVFGEMDRNFGQVKGGVDHFLSELSKIEPGIRIQCKIVKC